MVATGEEADENSRKDEHNEVDSLEIIGGDAASEDDRKSKDDADIENIAADDIADKKIGFPFFCSGYSSDELRKRSTESDDGEGNDTLRNANAGGDGAG